MTNKLVQLSELADKDQKIIYAILHFWFGHAEETPMPTPARLALWFQYDPQMAEHMKSQFGEHLEAAANGEYDHWLQSIRGQLAYILLLDQFSKKIFHRTAQAYVYDHMALAVSLEGAQHELEHDLSLLERAFYYFPFLHAEDLLMIENAIRAYEILTSYALDETKKTYQHFLDIATHHAKVIRTFGRYPERNHIIGRESSNEERLYLHTNTHSSDKTN